MKITKVIMLRLAYTSILLYFQINFIFGSSSFENNESTKLKLFFCCTIHTIQDRNEYIPHFFFSFCYFLSLRSFSSFAFFSFGQVAGGNTDLCFGTPDVRNSCSELEIIFFFALFLFFFISSTEITGVM